MNAARSIKIAVTALGGQGGGVLAGWIGKLGEENGFIAQTTSVPGVAQRTGATVYYIELFPQRAAQAAGKNPVLALMPVPGDVDIVIAAELMEAGRAMMRGFVSSQTTLIASTHRDYAIAEKSGMGDERQSGEAILNAARKESRVFIGADMAAAATSASTVISAVLFGALAGSGAVPINRACFEDQIKKGGRAVESNLLGFSLGYAIAEGKTVQGAASPTAAAVDTAASTAIYALKKRMVNEFPSVTHFYIGEGLKRMVDYQDAPYAGAYLDHLSAVLAIDSACGGGNRDWRLTQAVAKHLALWMTYEDSIRVADLKTRGARFARFHDDVRADSNQIVNVYEYMHPRVEEVCDILPAGFARTILKRKAFRKLINNILGGGKRVPTTKLHGFLPLFFLGSLRSVRRSSYRFQLEGRRIAEWLSIVQSSAKENYEFAIEIVQLQRLIKGYGDTYERGWNNFSTILSLTPIIKKKPLAAEELKKLRMAALTDEDGKALRAAVNKLSHPPKEAA